MFAQCILIGHTKTEADNQMLEIKKKQNLNSLGEVYHSHRFRDLLQFNEKYVDSQLLPESRRINQSLKKSISEKDIQVVIVSPQVASIQTCLDLFGERDGVQIYIQPLLQPRINCAAFIPTDNQELLKKFKKEPHSSNITQNKSWFLSFGPQDKQTHTSYSPQEHCLDTIRKSGDFELQSLFVERNKKMRKQLFEYIRRSKKTIALISHPLMLESLTATGWHEDGTLINAVKFDFGQIKRQYIWIEGVVAQAEEKHIPFCG